MLTYADACLPMLTYADLCWRMPTYADVCWRAGKTYTMEGEIDSDEKKGLLPRMVCAQGIRHKA
jgi:hypothetical protein